MKRIFLILLLAYAPAGFSQNIFDDEAAEKPEVKPPAAEKEQEKPAAKPAKKKKKARKKKKPAAKDAGVSANPSYTPEEIARSSYTWAPEAEALRLRSAAAGMKGVETVTAAAKPPSSAGKPESGDDKPSPQGGGFKLPQIPLAQVLIVAGFVILFLIYRFRVGRQIKRKRY